MRLIRTITLISLPTPCFCGVYFGARVWNVEQKSLLPGYYVQKINLEESSGGIYFVVLKQNDKQVSRKFLLIK